MNIIKIGGSVLRDKAGFARMVKIIKDYSSTPLLIVISAFSKATRQLEKAAELAEQGLEEKSSGILSQVLEWHVNFARDILTDNSHIESLLENFRSSDRKISDLLKGLIITKELTPRTLDAVLSYGELFALQTVNQYLLEQGFDQECIDSTNIIVSDSDYGSAQPLVEETQKKVNEILLPAIRKNKIVLTQGFVARNLQGEITTMGIESSNLTATLLAELLNIDEVVFWTDVEGIRTADPKIADVTKPLHFIDYDFAYKLGINGLKLIYPSMIAHAKSKNIKLKYLSAYEPDGDFTEISNKKSVERNSIIIQKENLTLININFESLEQMQEIRNSICKDALLSQSVFSINSNQSSIKLVLPQREIAHLKNIYKYIPEIIDRICAVTMFNISESSVINYLAEIYNLNNGRSPFEFETGNENDSSRFLVHEDFVNELIGFLGKKIIEN
ncbi:MAG: hypothetical protein ABSG15_10740 [FCB group bacterium]|jgi:aspartate kinase